MSAPSIVPFAAVEAPLYFVLCDYGPRVGLSYYEADPEKSDRETVISWLMVGQYTNPQQIIEVSLATGTARDVTEEIMAEVAERIEA